MPALVDSAMASPAQARRAGDSVRLYSVDHADLFISNVRDEASSLLCGLPHSLLLSSSHGALPPTEFIAARCMSHVTTTSHIPTLSGAVRASLLSGETSVLVPAWLPVRPQIAASPFSTELVLDRASAAGVTWTHNLEHPYYVYPVHVSLSFLYSTTLASALYLLLCRYLAREYKQAILLVDTVSSDTFLNAEEKQILDCMGRSPDMCASHLRHAWGHLERKPKHTCTSKS